MTLPVILNGGGGGGGDKCVSKTEQLALGEFHNLPYLGHGCILDLI